MCCFAQMGVMYGHVHVHVHEHTNVPHVYSDQLCLWFCLCLKTASCVYRGYSIPWWHWINLKCLVQNNWMAVSLKRLYPLMSFRFTTVSESGSWSPPGFRDRGRAGQSVCSGHVAWPPEPEEANLAVEAHIHWLWGNSDSVFSQIFQNSMWQQTWFKQMRTTSSMSVTCAIPLIMQCGESNSRIQL